MSLASPSELYYCVGRQGFDWSGFIINIIVALITGIITGYLVSEYFSRKDAIKEYPEKCIRMCGVAMTFSILANDALRENTSLSYGHLTEKIYESNYLITIPKSKYIKDEFTDQIVEKMRSKIVELSSAATALKTRLKVKTSKDSFYLQNKEYIENDITKNLEILENSSKQLFDLAVELREHIK